MTVSTNPSVSGGGGGGQGVPVGGTAGQALTKIDATNFNTQWSTVSGTGTVTSASVVSANGFTGSVATATTTPAITLTTSATGILKGSTGALVAATAGTDYSAGTNALATGILKSTTTTGALSIAVAGDFPTLNQSTTGSAATLTTPRAINGVNFDGSAAITVTAAAGTLSGATLASGITASSLTSVGTLTTGLWNATVVGAIYGGTGQTTYATGDLLYASAANTLSKRAAGTDGQILTQAAGIPTWADNAALPNAPLVVTAGFTFAKATHANRRIGYNSVSAGNATFDGTAAFTTDDGFRLMQENTGTVTLVASGVTFLNPNSLSLTTTGQGSYIDAEWDATASKLVITSTGAGGGGSATWGGITGTLSSQTDLQSALNLKAPLAAPALTGAASFSGMMSDLSTATSTPATSAATITFPNNISSYFIDGTSTIFNITLNMPATPVNGQSLTIRTKPAINRITHSGNGATLPWPLTGLQANTSATYRYYSANTTWVLEVEPSRVGTYTSGGTRVVNYDDGTSTLRWDWLGTYSWQIYYQNQNILSQSTADGLSTRLGNLLFKTENTLDVTNAAAGNGQFSYSGFQARTYNSSSAYAGGQTNDKPLNIYLVNTGQKFAGGNNIPSWTGSPTGANNWLTFENADMQIGSVGASGKQVMKWEYLTGNVTLSNAYANTSEQRDTGTASFTISNNITNVVLAGSGTVTVTMPATPIDGQIVSLCLETAYTAVTAAANAGQTIVTGAAIAVTAGSFARFRYRLAATKWLRVG